MIIFVLSDNRDMHGAAGLIFCGVRKHDWSVTLKKENSRKIVDFVKLPFKPVIL